MRIRRRARRPKDGWYRDFAFLPVAMKYDYVWLEFYWHRWVKSGDSWGHVERLYIDRDPSHYNNLVPDYVGEEMFTRVTT
jgi:hypothetical protein